MKGELHIWLSAGCPHCTFTLNGVSFYPLAFFQQCRYLIAEANYGGRVTDELDRRVIASYLNKFYCEDVLAIPSYPLSPLPTYLSSFKDYITGLPTLDPPEAFGQHPNAEISYLIEDSKVRLRFQFHEAQHCNYTM
jgi:Dynein heavy chain AAA lid domain